MRNRHLTAMATAVAAGVLGAGAVLLAPAAQAAPVYPPGAPAISVSATSVDPGTAVTVTGTGLQPLSAVTVSWTGPGARGMAATAMPFGTRALAADASGTVTTSITFSVSGTHTITLTGVDPSGAPVSLSATVQVSAAPAAGGELSHTGFPLLQYLLAALGLLLVGVAIVYLVRRRRAGSVAPAAAAQQTQPLEPANS